MRPRRFSRSQNKKWDGLVWSVSVPTKGIRYKADVVAPARSIVRFVVKVYRFAFPFCNPEQKQSSDRAFAATNIPRQLPYKAPQRTSEQRTDLIQQRLPTISPAPSAHTLRWPRALGDDAGSNRQRGATRRRRRGRRLCNHVNLQLPGASPGASPARRACRAVARPTCRPDGQHPPTADATPLPYARRAFACCTSPARLACGSAKTLATNRLYSKDT